MSTATTNSLLASRSLRVRGARSMMLSLLASLALTAPVFAQTGTTDPKPADAKAAAPSDAKVNKLDLPFDNLGTNKDEPGAAVVYLIKIRGEVGSDYGVTPLRRSLDDAMKLQPDVIILDIDSQTKSRQPGDDEDGEEFQGTREAAAYDYLDRVLDMSDELVDRIRDDKKWTKKPRVVAWVKRATGTAAFLPFVCKEIYYSPRAQHGGIGYLDFLFNGRGDYVVREKQRSLRMGKAEGIAIKGGHDYRLMRAMARMDYVLSYTMVGGKPEFHEDMSGDTILTDDGNPDAGRADTAEDVIRGTGNDLLTLTSPVAKRIGFINGEAESLDDLAFELGIQRSYKVYGRRADRFAEDWRKLVDSIAPQFRDLQRQAREWRLTGDTAAERNQSRAKLKRILQKMVELITRNKEVGAAGGFPDPDGYADRIRQQIAEIDQAIRLDRDR